MAKNKILDLVSTLMESYCESPEGTGLELYHQEYVKEGSDRVLRIYIDRREDYVSTDDCERVSKYLSEKLDESDPIEQNYILEVSSPGMDRVLVTPSHFERYIGELIEVSLYKEVEGSKKLTGLLKSYSNGDVVIEAEVGDPSTSKEIELKEKEIAKVNLAIVI